MKTIVTLLFVIVIANVVHAQNIFPSTGAAGIGTTVPDASALLEINSNSQGFLPPRMKQADRIAIKFPATGLLLYQTDGTKGLYYFNGSAWTTLAPISANTKLSNLSSPTAINLSLLPKTTTSLDLGSSLLNWKNIYLSGSIYQGSTRIFNTGNGIVAVGDNSLLNNTGSANTATGYSSLNHNTTGRSNTAAGFMALLSNTTGNNNTAAGVAALGFNTTGSFNTATGDSALAFNNTGINNTANGKNALYYNTGGERNTATGSNALFSNSTGSWNVANGAEALYANTTGYFNTANGFYSLNKNTTGSRNTSAGSYSLYNNSTGFQNAAYGVDALNANTTGSTNTGVGFEVLFRNTTGVGNSAVGSQALNSNTTGYYNTSTGINSLYNNTTGSINTASGEYSLYQNTTGFHNTGIGGGSLYANTTGYWNAGLGSFALNYNTTGYGNTAAGYSALAKNTTGNNNTAIGFMADCGNNYLTNATAIGSYAEATGSDQVMLGSTTIRSVMAAGNYVIYSDGRFKKNIRENVPGLDFIRQLRPVTYNYDITKLNNYIKSTGKEKEEPGLSPEAKKGYDDAITRKEKKMYTGFVAQEVEKIADKLGFDFSGVYKPQNDKDPYGLSYADFVVPLVKAVQEISKSSEEKDAKIDALEKRLIKLEEMMNAAHSSTNNAIPYPADVSLQQNAPNPFNNTTSIAYSLPLQYSKAKIVVTDNEGRTMKQFIVNGTGKGAIKLDTFQWAAGGYHYSLYIDDKLIESKQLFIAR